MGQDLLDAGEVVARQREVGSADVLVEPIGVATVHHITTTAFTGGLNKILLVASIIAPAAAVVAFATFRQKDFAHQPS